MRACRCSSQTQRLFLLCVCLLHCQAGAFQPAAGRQESSVSSSIVSPEGHFPPAAHRLLSSYNGPVSPINSHDSEHGSGRLAQLTGRLRAAQPEDPLRPFGHAGARAGQRERLQYIGLCTCMLWCCKCWCACKQQCAPCPCRCLCRLMHLI